MFSFQPHICIYYAYKPSNLHIHAGFLHICNAICIFVVRFAYFMRAYAHFVQTSLLHICTCILSQPYSSLELNSPQTSLSRSRHRIKRSTTVLSVLAQAVWQFWNVALLQSLCSLSCFCCEVRIFSGCTGREESYAQHYMMFTTATVELGNPLLTSDNVVSLSHCLTLVQQYLPRVWRVEEKEHPNVSQSMKNGKSTLSCIYP